MSNATDNVTDLLQKLQNGEMTLEACQKELNTKKKTESNVTWKVSPKGCISFYGVRRMPISLYRQELESILDSILDGISYNEDFSAFLEENEGKISLK
jgi:hypothetical protein